MITLTREEAQQVLNDLEGEIPFYSENDCNTPEWITNAIELLRAKLSAPELEPVAVCILKTLVGIDKNGIEEWKEELLYTAPPQREWAGLTDAEYEAMAEQYVTNCYFDTLKYAKAIEAKLRDKNS